MRTLVEDRNSHRRGGPEQQPPKRKFGLDDKLALLSRAGLDDNKFRELVRLPVQRVVADDAAQASAEPSRKRRKPAASASASAGHGQAAGPAQASKKRRRKKAAAVAAPAAAGHGRAAAAADDDRAATTSRKLSVRDAIEATLEQLGLTVAEGQTLKDQVAMAFSQLGLPVAGTLRDQGGALQRRRPAAAAACRACRLVEPSNLN